MEVLKEVYQELKTYAWFQWFQDILTFLCLLLIVYGFSILMNNLMPQM